MKYVINKTGKECYVNHTTTTMVLSKERVCWRSAFCHEVAHCLLAKYSKDHSKSAPFTHFFGTVVTRFVLIGEHLAMRIGKAMCKPEYWDEEAALNALKTYWEAVFLDDYGPKPSFPDHIEPLTDVREIKKLVTW